MKRSLLLSARPKIAELVFQLYGRTVHPELFHTYKTKEIERGDYTAKVEITSAGHVVRWRREGLTLTEIATASHHPLPKRRRIMSHSLSGSRSDQCDCGGGVTYEVEFSLESVSADAFNTFQKEITLAGGHQGMVHHFDPNGRFGPGALSYVNVLSRDHSLLIQALHTFPDDYAIVKSQSVFRMPS